MRYVQLALVTAAMAVTAPALAITYNETGDTGELPGTAQSAVGANSISGFLANLGTITPLDDVDLYSIFIANPAAFSVTTTAALSADNDAQLFLFDSGGAFVLEDDDDGPGLLPQINVGELLGAAGFYYLAIDLFDTDPTFTGGVLSGWNRDPDPFQTGNYTLTLTGIGDPRGVPEPGVIGLLGLGALGLAVARRRKA